jgi:hypothetical protein
MTDNDETPPRGGRRARIAAVVAVAVVAGAVLAIAITRSSGGSTAREDDMSQTAAAIMPFDLEATTHTFTKSAAGGIQEVVANDHSDARNIELIRSHLAVEAQEFRKGNFSDPAKIHGMDMPGTKELEAGAARVEVQYEPIDAGGRITYSSSDPTLIAALHSWFDRQRTDHAMPGMGG